MILTTAILCIEEAWLANQGLSPARGWSLSRRFPVRESETALAECKRQSRWPTRCSGETRNSPIDAGFENRAGSIKKHKFAAQSSSKSLLFNSRKFGTSRSLVIRRLPITPVFTGLPCGLLLHFHLRRWPRSRGNAKYARRQPMTLRIERSTRPSLTVFTLSGRMEAEQVPELKELFDCDYQNIILDLRDIRLADGDSGS